MSDLRSYLEKYVADINDILDSNTDDKEIKEAARSRWKESQDHRRMVFLNITQSLRLPSGISPNSGGNDLGRSSNEISSSGVSPQNTPFYTFLEKYATAINAILLNCQNDQDIIVAAKKKQECGEWKAKDPRLLVFTNPAN
jgi:hypothetical protein